MFILYSYRLFDRNKGEEYDLSGPVPLPLSVHGLEMDKKKPGNYLLSHQVTLAVPSAHKGLTSVFGMGTGVSPSL